jgi:uncharacterized protein with von Willebrand factor type A (vWA) domain
VIHKYGPDYKLVFVGDASMSPYEILQPWRQRRIQQPGAAWLRRLADAEPGATWLRRLGRHAVEDRQGALR